MEKEEKNNPKQEFSGRNLEDAIGLAELTLKLPRSQMNYEIVAEKTKLFGIKTKEIVIVVWPKVSDSEDPSSQFLKEFLHQYPLKINFHVKEKSEILYFIFDGPDKHFLLRNDGELLLAFQHILNKMSQKKVQTDCDFFRKRKERELQDYVQNIARQVYKTGKDEVLDYLNPYERRIVHIAVNKISGITSESIDDGFLKRVKIFPAKKQ